MVEKRNEKIDVFGCTTVLQDFPEHVEIRKDQ